MKLLTIPNYLDIKVINYINRIVETTNENDFSEERFNEWLIEVEVESKANPSAYIRSCFKTELEKGTFRPRAKVEYIPNTQDLINQMRIKGICVLADESVWVSVLYKYLLNEKHVDSATCKKLNQSILNFMETKCFKEYKELVMNSNTLKPYDINWEYIEAETKAEINKWNAMLDDLESEE